MILSGRDVEWYITSGNLVIEGIKTEQFQQNGVDLVLNDIEGKPECFCSGKFYLGCLKEKVKLPCNLMAFVELRSTWARQGLMIPPTIIDAGFEGDITLEIVSFNDIPVPYGQRFAHIVFANLTSPSVPYSGKYQRQQGITGPKDDKN